MSLLVFYLQYYLHSIILSTNIKDMNKLPAKLPLFTVISAVFTIQLLLVSGFTAYTTYQAGRRSLIGITEDLIHTTVDRIGDHLHSFLELPHRINDMNSAFIRQNHLEYKNNEILKYRFLSQIRSFDSVSSIYLGNPEGGLVLGGRETNSNTLYTITTDNLIKGTFRKYEVDDSNIKGELLLSVPDFDARTRPWYKAAVKNKGKSWSEVYVLFTGQDMAIAASQPVFDITGNITGVLSIDLFLSHLQNFLNRINISKNGEIFIIERSGLLIASSTSEIPIKKDITKNSSRRLFAGESRESFIHETAGEIKSIFGDFSNIIKDEHFDFRIGKENYMAHISPLKDEYGIDWLIVVAIPEKDYMEDIWKNNAQLIYILIAAAIISSLLSLLTSSWIVRPVQRLNLSAGKLIEKKWVLKEESYFIREIDSLDSSFNRMAIQLTDTLKELTEEVKERKEAEKNMISLLKEKDVLLQEIHHRVKNNLQLITSLLKIQRAKIDDKKYAEIFRESQNRVGSMALIHQQLYQSENFNQVNLEEYIKSLIRSLLKSYQNSSVHIETEVRVEENLPLDYAIPCGLIINELVTNSLKYAFHELEKGKISVKLESDNKQIILVISDNGSGIPKNIEFDTSDTLGLYLVKIIVEDQLHGTVKIDREKGTEFRITFNSRTIETGENG